MSARVWGRTGILLAVLASCATQPTPPPVALPVQAVDTVEWPPPDLVAADAPLPEAPVSFSGPVAPAVAPAVPSGPRRGGGWAVVVGIDDYPGGGHDLRSAGNDADAMVAVLAAAGFGSERQLVLRDGQATADAVRQALDWLVARAGPDATAAFFFAGHVRQMGGSTEALVGADGGLVPDTEVAHRLRDLQASRTWLVLATCYAGGFDEVLAPGRILTAAAPAGRLAYESLAMRRSYLVEYLLHRALLEGRSASSVEAAFAWAEAAIGRDHPNRVPVQFDRLPGELTLGPPVLAASSTPSSSPGTEDSSRPAPAATTTTTTTTTTAPERRDRDCGVTVGTLLHCPD